MLQGVGSNRSLVVLGFLAGEEKCSKIRYWQCAHNPMDILKTAELYILKG